MRTLESPSFDVYFNLALEEHLMLTCKPGERILYFWRNDRTVVIGRNQDPWRECPVELLEQEGVKLARRKSGGGAVYHDKGNLNYTFITYERDSNIERQLLTVVNALGAIGIDAEVSGRNDILVGGRKVSGNAFYKSGDLCCHHGTLMVNVDMDAVSRYLSPGSEKLRAKGVASVRSRVIALKELDQSISVDRLREAMIAAFTQLVNDQTGRILVSDLNLEDIRRRALFFSDRRWIFGDEKRYDFEISHRFTWGDVMVQADIDRGMISAIRVRSDALDPEIAGKLEKTLIGTECIGAADAVRHCAGVKEREEIGEWLSEAPFGG